MTRMTAATLRDKLQDEDAEIRRAAALACAMKDDKTHIPDLIAALDDSELLVIRAARAGLKSLTGQDFGPTADATRAQRVQAVADWKTWWNNQARK
jgi:HEAT repeat protein